MGSRGGGGRGGGGRFLHFCIGGDRRFPWSGSSSRFIFVLARVGRKSATRIQGGGGGGRERGGEGEEGGGGNGILGVELAKRGGEEGRGGGDEGGEGRGVEKEGFVGWDWGRESGIGGAVGGAPSHLFHRRIGATVNDGYRNGGVDDGA